MSKYVRIGNAGALLLAALGVPVRDETAEANAKAALDAVTAMNEKFAELSAHIATNDTVDDERAAEFADLAADFSDVVAALRGEQGSVPGASVDVGEPTPETGGVLVQVEPTTDDGNGGANRTGGDDLGGQGGDQGGTGGDQTQGGTAGTGGDQEQVTE